nr:type II secretion system F family protein [Arthrobacter zhangbolii]
MALAGGAGENAVGSLERVSAAAQGELAGEFRRVLAQTRAGTPLTAALEELSDRIRLAPLTRFVDGVSVAVERGTPLADVMRAQAQDVRDAAKRELMETAGKKEIAMMVPNKMYLGLRRRQCAELSADTMRQELGVGMLVLTARRSRVRLDTIGGPNSRDSGLCSVNSRSSTWSCLGPSWFDRGANAYRGSRTRPLMGRNRQNNRPPVDMSIKVEDQEYRPPDVSSCDVVEYPFDLGDGHSLFVTQRIYRKKIVDFAIMQLFTEGDKQHEIARIDCCHGVVHRHVFDRQGNDLVDRQILRKIEVSQNPWDTVDSEFGICNDRMSTEYMENYRRWSR